MVASQQDSSVCPSHWAECQTQHLRQASSQHPAAPARRSSALCCTAGGSKATSAGGRCWITAPVIPAQLFLGKFSSKARAQPRARSACRAGLPAQAQQGTTRPFWVKTRGLDASQFSKGLPPTAVLLLSVLPLEPGPFWMPLQEGHLCTSAAGGSTSLVLHSLGAARRPRGLQGGGKLCLEGPFLKLGLCSTSCKIWAGLTCWCKRNSGAHSALPRECLRERKVKGTRTSQSSIAVPIAMPSLQLSCHHSAPGRGTEKCVCSTAPQSSYASHILKRKV